MIERIKQTATWAAKWWADHLRSRPPLLDNGGRDFASGMAMAMGSLIQDRLPKVSDDQIDRFEALLAQAIVDDLEKRIAWPGRDANEPYCTCDLGTDYAPDPIISDAGKAAGIDLAYRLPIKTMMWVHPFYVELRAGYGDDQQTPFDIRTNAERAMELRYRAWSSAVAAERSGATAARADQLDPAYWIGRQEFYRGEVLRLLREAEQLV
jgi:hypothetical protein